MEKSQVDSPFSLIKDPLNGREGTVFDQPAPTGPPNAPTRSIPPHLGKVLQFMTGIIADESLLLDLCVDRAVEIVKFNYDKRAYGNDLMTEQQPTPMHFVGMAGPLAVELYKQVLTSIMDRKDEYATLLAEAQKEMQSAGRPTPKIFVP